MKTLLTGANGLVGSTIEADIRVTGKDQIDLTNFADTEDLFQQTRPTHVIHCAGRVGGLGANLAHMGEFFYDNMLINLNVLEAARRAITRHIKRQGRVWIRIFPDVPVTKKPTEVRMGKGKGSVEFWAAKVKPGRIMFELDGVTESLAREALELGSAKLPIRTKFVTRQLGV